MGRIGLACPLRNSLLNLAVGLALLALSPQMAEALSQLQGGADPLLRTKALRDGGNLPEALEAATAALRAEPGRRDLRMELGFLLGALGRHQEALAGYPAGLAGHPGDAGGPPAPPPAWPPSSPGGAMWRGRGRPTSSMPGPDRPTPGGTYAWETSPPRRAMRRRRRRASGRPCAWTRPVPRRGAARPAPRGRRHRR